MATEAYAGDSIALIDISWPLPENVNWNFGTDAKVIYNGEDWAMIKFETEGTYTIGMSAQLATCSGYHQQTITILKAVEGGRIAADNLIKDLKLFPNPSEGNFSIAIELSRVHDIDVSLVSLSGNRTVYHEKKLNQTQYNRDYNFEDLPSGIYFLFVKVGNESRIIRLVIL
jgi:hypothetical protein